MPQVEYEQVLVGRWRAKESVEVYQDLRGEFGSAGGMVDSQPGIITHDERIGCEGFGTVGTPFRQTRNPCPKALFVVDDEHDGLPLSELSHTCLCCRSNAEKYIPILPDALARSEGLFIRKQRVPKYVPPS